MADRFFWYELMTSDPAAATAFYRDVVGWTAEPFASGGMDYVVLGVGDRGIGGLMAMPEHYRAGGGKPAWSGYIRTADVDAAVARLVEAGTIGWNELHAGDGEQAFAFYAGQFGWTEDGIHDMGAWGHYRLFAVDGVQSGGIMTAPPGSGSPHWSFYIVVDGVEAAIGRIEAGGGQVVNGPHQVPGGAYIATCVDPPGAAPRAADGGAGCRATQGEGDLQSGHVEDGRVAHFQVTMKIGFKIED